MNKTFLSEMKICLFTCWCISNGTYCSEEDWFTSASSPHKAEIAENVMDKTLSHEWGRVWWIFKGNYLKVTWMFSFYLRKFSIIKLTSHPHRPHKSFAPHSPAKIHFALCSSFITKDDNKMHWNAMKTRRNEK